MNEEILLNLSDTKTCIQTYTIFWKSAWFSFSSVYNTIQYKITNNNNNNNNKRGYVYKCIHFFTHKNG